MTFILASSTIMRWSTGEEVDPTFLHESVSQSNQVQAAVLRTLGSTTKLIAVEVGNAFAAPPLASFICMGKPGIK